MLAIVEDFGSEAYRLPKKRHLNQIRFNQRTHTSTSLRDLLQEAELGKQVGPWSLRHREGSRAFASLCLDNLCSTVLSALCEGIDLLWGHFFLGSGLEHATKFILHTRELRRKQVRGFKPSEIRVIFKSCSGSSSSKVDQLPHSSNYNSKGAAIGTLFKTSCTFRKFMQRKHSKVSLLLCRKR